jgi:hypothetical protein
LRSHSTLDHHRRMSDSEIVYQNIGFETDFKPDKLVPGFKQRDKQTSYHCRGQSFPWCSVVIATTSERKPSLIANCNIKNKWYGFFHVLILYVHLFQIQVLPYLILEFEVNKTPGPTVIKLLSILKVILNSYILVWELGIW